MALQAAMQRRARQRGDDGLQRNEDGIKRQARVNAQLTSRLWSIEVRIIKLQARVNAQRHDCGLLNC